METHSYIVEGIGPLDFGYDGHPLGPGTIEVWKKVPQVFDEIEIDFGDGPVKFVSNWEKYTEYFIETAEENIFSYTALEKIKGSASEEEIKHFFKNEEKKINNKPIVEPSVEIKIEENKSYNGDKRLLIDQYLSFVFIALNIAAPGSTDFTKAFYKSSKENSYKSDIFYTAMYFEMGWRDGIKFGWPSVSAIDLESVVNWLKKNKIFYGMTAKSRLQSVVFLLLNLSKYEDIYSPMNVLWVSQSLEALIDSPSIQISKYLKNRLFLILGNPEKFKNKIKSQINDFYNLRSRIVHGQFSICHPLYYFEGMDEGHDEYIHKYALNPVSFAMAIVISVLQNYILNNWSKLTYREIINPDLFI